MFERLGLTVAGNIPIRELVSVTKNAENAGFESFWIHETYFMRDAVTQLTAAMLSSQRIRLATGCINPFTRNATVIAMTMATLDEYSPGRLVLGIGTGYPMRLDQMGIRLERPVAKLENRIGEIRELLSGGTVQNGARLMFKTPETRIPVYIGVRGQAMLRMAGRVGDGYLAAPAESAQSIRRIVRLLSSSRKSANKIGKMEVAANILTYLSAEGKTSLDVVRKDPFVIYMMAVLDDVTLLDSGFKFEDRAKVAVPYMKGRLDEASSYITDELLHSFAAIGSEEEVAGKIDEYMRAGVDLPVLLPVKPDRASIDRLIKFGNRYISSR